MKQQLVKLFILFIAMSVLTSSSKDSGSSRKNQALQTKSTCPYAKKDDVAVVSCKQLSLSDKPEDVKALTLADNEISLSPISRFILVQ